jgi:hypothetical protein
MHWHVMRSFPVEGRRLGISTRVVFNPDKQKSFDTQYRKYAWCIPKNEIVCGLVPNSYTNVSMSDLYIPTTISLRIVLQENRWTDREKI